MSHLTYYHLAWHFYKNLDYRKLERLQERALKAIDRSHSESYEELLVRAKLLTLYNRRLQDTAVLMYKVTYGLTPIIVYLICLLGTIPQMRSGIVILLYPANILLYCCKHVIILMGPFYGQKLQKA